MNAADWVDLAVCRDEFRPALRRAYTVEVDWPEFPTVAAHVATDGHRIHVAPARGNPVTVDTRAAWILTPLPGVIGKTMPIGRVDVRDLRRAAKEAKTIGTARYERERADVLAAVHPRKTLRSYEKPIRYAPAVRIGDRWYNAAYMLDALKGARYADVSAVPDDEFTPIMIRRPDEALAFVMPCNWKESDGWPTVVLS